MIRRPTGSCSADQSRVSRPRVLVAGVYLLDRPNNVQSIIVELGSSVRWDIEQRWVALGKGRVPRQSRHATSSKVRKTTPKFTLLNEVLCHVDPSEYAYIVVCDDDVELPAGFLDDFLHHVKARDFSLAQPARSHDSFIDHPFVRQRAGMSARQTRFVEIGPLFCIRADAISLLLPFDETSPMGWGYDFVWPHTLETAGLTLGIIDAVVVQHSLRKPNASYDGQIARRQMQALLARRAHLTPGDAFVNVRTWAACP